MKNNKWNIKSNDDRDMNVVFFVSRNKDNKNIENFTERRMSFTTKETVDSKKLNDLFMNFVHNGLPGEMCRMYFSVNTRDETKVYNQLLHFLINNPTFNLCSIESKVAGIAAINENAKTKHWMFDFDINDDDSAELFIASIKEIDPTVNVSKHKTPNGYAIIADHGFDTRPLYEKWPVEYCELKRDALLCVKWTINWSK